MQVSKFIFILLILVLSPLYAVELRVGAVQIEGNAILDDEQILRVLDTKPGANFDQSVVNSDAKKISALYQERGYHNIKVLTPQITPKNPDDIIVLFTVIEEAQVIIDSISVSGNRYISDRVLWQSIPKEEYSFATLENLIKEITHFYASQGFIFTNVSLDHIESVDDRFVAHIIIEEHTPMKAERITFAGNEITRESTLLKLAQLDQYEYLSPQNIRQAEENIRRREYIRDCEIIPIDPNHLHISITEDRMSYISGILGYNESRHSDNKLSGYIDVDFLNLYGTDRSISLNWHRPSALQSSINLHYHESGPYSIPISGDFSLYRKEQDSTYIQTSFDSEIYYYTPNHKYGIYIGLETIYPGSRRPKLLEKTSYRKIGTFWEFDNVHFVLNPTAGNRIFFKYFYIFHQDDEKLNTKQAVETQWQIYRTVLPQIVFYSRLNGKYIENKDLKDFEYYSLGGNQDLRGFMEDQFYGYLTGFANLELRYLLSYSSRAFLFLDYGYVQNNDYTYGDLFGFGLGMRLETRLGTVGIDYGLSYHNRNFRNPMDGVLHISLKTRL